jgi:hypothetical protein
MTISGNGDPVPPARRIRVDDRRSFRFLGQAHSGRRFVVLAIACLLALWIVLFLFFRDWRARYRERTAQGKREVSAAIQPLARVVPPDISAREWTGMVAQTDGMLSTLVGSNTLDAAAIKAVRDQVATRVARARPETALDDMLAIWSDAEEKAGPAISHASRPRLLDLAIAVDALARISPPGVEPGAWRRELAETQTRLIDLSRTGRFDDERRQQLRSDWSRLIDDARARPKNAPSVLRSIKKEAMSDEQGSAASPGLPVHIFAHW